MGEILRFPERPEQPQGPREFHVSFYQFDAHQCGYEIEGIELTERDALCNAAAFLEDLADILRAEADEL